MASSDVHNNSGHLEMPLAVKKSDPNISKITKRTPFTKVKEGYLNQMQRLIL